MSRPQSRWQDAHIALKRLYDERVPKNMSQEEFGALYEIGTQGMVSQYLKGTTPLNFEAAAKFAKGLRCTIHDISPEMARALQRDILPVLGHGILKAALAKAALVFIVVGALPYPSTTQATDLSNNIGPAYYVKWLWQRFILLPGYAAQAYRALRSSIYPVVSISQMTGTCQHA